MPCMRDYGKTWDYKNGAYYPRGLAKMAFRWVVEYKDGRVVDHIHESIDGATWPAKSTPVRELPSGRRTIRIEE